MDEIKKFNAEDNTRTESATVRSTLSAQIEVLKGQLSSKFESLISGLSSREVEQFGAFRQDVDSRLGETIAGVKKCEDDLRFFDTTLKRCGKKIAELGGKLKEKQNELERLDVNLNTLAGYAAILENEKESMGVGCWDAIKRCWDSAKNVLKEMFAKDEKISEKIGKLVLVNPDNVRELLAKAWKHLEEEKTKTNSEINKLRSDLENKNKELADLKKKEDETKEELASAWKRCVDGVVKEVKKFAEYGVHFDIDLFSGLTNTISGYNISSFTEKMTSVLGKLFTEMQKKDSQIKGMEKEIEDQTENQLKSYLGISKKIEVVGGTLGGILEQQNSTNPQNQSLQNPSASNSVWSKIPFSNLFSNLFAKPQNQSLQNPPAPNFQQIEANTPPGDAGVNSTIGIDTLVSSFENLKINKRNVIAQKEKVKKEINTLMTKAEGVKTAFFSLKQENDKKDVEIAQLKVKLKEEENRFSDMFANNGSFRQEIEKELTECKKELEKKNAELKEGEGTAKEGREIINELLLKINDLNTVLDRKIEMSQMGPVIFKFVEDSVRKKLQLRANIFDMKEERRRLENEIYGSHGLALRNQILNLKEKISKLERQSNEQKKEMEVRGREFSELTVKYNTLANENVQLAAKLQYFEQNESTFIGNTCERIRTMFQGALIDNATSCDNYINMISRLEKSLTSVNALVAGLTQLAKNPNLKNELQQFINSINGVAVMVNGACVSIANLGATIANLKQYCHNRAGEEITKLSSNIDSKNYGIRLLQLKGLLSFVNSLENAESIFGDVEKTLVMTLTSDNGKSMRVATTNLRALICALEITDRLAKGKSFSEVDEQWLGKFFREACQNWQAKNFDQISAIRILFADIVDCICNAFFTDQNMAQIKGEIFRQIDATLIQNIQNIVNMPAYQLVNNLGDLVFQVACKYGNSDIKHAVFESSFMDGVRQQRNTQQQQFQAQQQSNFTQQQLNFNQDQFKAQQGSNFSYQHQQQGSNSNQQGLNPFQR